MAALTAMSSHAFAWKPYTHVFAANEAVATVLAGNNYVVINGQQYDVIPEVADAIRNFPDFYRAGVIGPDAYPDIYVGQGFIHPDTRNANGNGPWESGDGHSFSYEWLRHVYQAGWAKYNATSGNDDGQKCLAFAYGYLTHAAGDMWAHSFVNDIAAGVFPDITDVPNLDIAARHIVVEGYVGKWTPSTLMSIPNGDATLSDFIYKTLMLHGARGGFVDSAGNDTKKLGRGAINDFFFDLRDSLRTQVDFMYDNWFLFDPVTFVTVTVYCEAWIDDIDYGMQQWPYVSQDVAYQLFVNNDFAAAGSAAGDFVVPTVLEMIGVPDTIALLAWVFQSIMDAIGTLIEPLANAAVEFANYMVSQATGIDILAMIEYVTTPENHINSGLIGLAPDTSATLDGLMGRSGSDPFNPNLFAPMKNTIVSSKLILLSPDALNEVLYDNRVGDLYELTVDNNDKENFLLGFIRTLDGNQQWRKHTTKDFVNNPVGNSHGEGMLMWRDCLARNRAFRTLFTDWQNGVSTFPDLGEAGELLSDTPNPDSTIQVNGANVLVSGTLFVGNTTTFTVTGTPSYWWNSNEMTAFGQVSPGGSELSDTTSVEVGPITGADGPYQVSFRAEGICPGGPAHVGPSDALDVTLDATPPVITVPFPAEGQVFDVISTGTFDMNMTDGPGSGVDGTNSYATFDGAPTTDGAYIDAFLLDAGDHIFYIYAVDLIGNASDLTVTFSVHATILGLKGAVTRAFTEGLITKPTTEKALQSLLNSAQKSFLKNDFGTAKNKVAAARDLVAGQLGSGVDTTFGTRFIGWCNDLINRL